jgi:hypothetical protein
MRLIGTCSHLQCALITGAVVQVLTWPQAQTASELPLGFWHSSLVISLVAICLATQQSIALNRISSYKDFEARIRSMLGHKVVSKDNDRRVAWTPRKLQLYIWQTPIVHLNFGILGFVVGLGIMVFESRKGMDDSGPVSNGLDAKMRCLSGPRMFSVLADCSWQALFIVGFFSAFYVVNYFFSTGVLHRRICCIEE